MRQPYLPADYNRRTTTWLWSYGRKEQAQLSDAVHTHGYLFPVVLVLTSA